MRGSSQLSSGSSQLSSAHALLCVSTLKTLQMGSGMTEGTRALSCYLYTIYKNLVKKTATTEVTAVMTLSPVTEHQRVSFLECQTSGMKLCPR